MWRSSDKRPADNLVKWFKLGLCRFRMLLISSIYSHTVYIRGVTRRNFELTRNVSSYCYRSYYTGIFSARNVKIYENQSLRTLRWWVNTLEIRLFTSHPDILCRKYGEKYVFFNYTKTLFLVCDFFRIFSKI